jgi:tetratricopeptide (TPR) repeat protein
VSHFVPRKALIARLDTAFNSALENLSQLVIIVLLGMGGSGKSQLALEWCHRMRETRKFKAIFWLDASSRPMLHHAMDTVAKMIAPERSFNNSQAATTFVIETLSGWDDPWLMVFDNLDNPSDLQDINTFFPNAHHGVILVTSRYAGTKELGHSIELDCMERDESLELLLGPPEARSGDVAVADVILKRLGYLPLAIDQARAYMSKRRLSPQSFLVEFDKRKETIMKETPRYWQYQSTLPNQEKTPQSLLTTWEMSLNLLGGIGEDAAPLQDVLTLFAFFHHARISERIFTDDPELTSPMSAFYDCDNWDHTKFRDAVVQMQELSLLQFSYDDQDEIVVSLHTMVSEWLRIRCDDGSRRSRLTEAVGHLRTYLDTPMHLYYESRQEVLSHIDAISSFAEFVAGDIHFMGAHHTFGYFCRTHNQFDDAEMFYKMALAVSEKTLGPEHTSTLSTVNNLGNLYANQGRLDETERMYNRALAGYQETLGPEHTSTLVTVNNLGNLYADQGHLDEAERMYDRALAGKEKALGPEHTSTLDTVNNLGSLYADQGRLDEAERMYDRALTGKEKALGPGHTSTLNTVNNLGLLYTHQGHLDEAERMYDRALMGYEKALGPDHHLTHRIRRNLANLRMK